MLRGPFRPALGVGLLLVALSTGASAQDTHLLTGTVADYETKEPLAGATVLVGIRGLGTTTDAQGRFTLPLRADDSFRLQFSYVGYETDYRTVVMRTDRTLTVELSPRQDTIDELTVEAESDESVMAPLAGVGVVEIEELAGLPQLLGEVDVNRSLLQLPGIASVGEGASGFNVRGGNVDQNLVLLDGSQVFFSSHLFGLFSLFHPDLVDDVTVYKGGVPARYGGRASSVIDVRQRAAEGDRARGVAGVGLTASRLTLEAPLGDRASVVVGGRASYLNWMLRLAERAEVKASRASYADFGAKLSVRPSGRVQGALTGYFGGDRFRFGADTTYAYRTANLAASATAVVGPRLSLELGVAGTDYAYGLESDDPTFAFDYRAGVQHAAARVGLVGDLGANQTVEGGVEVGGYRTRPGTLTPGPASPLQPTAVDDERAVEAAAYAATTLGRGGLRATLGLRYSLWTTLGPASVPTLDPDDPSAVTGAVAYGAGEVVARYGGLEPRVALRYAFGDSTVVKLGYDRLRQYVHLVSNTTAPTAVDRWKLSDPLVRPQVGDQVSATVGRELASGVRLSVEGYYRWLHDLVDYRPGAQLLLNPTLGADLLAGSGRAYGAEVLLRRTTGAVTGWVSYTLSRAERTVDDRGQRVNFGRPYPADFDRPHDLSVALSWQAAPRFRWGAGFVYGSGRPITYPTGAYRLGDLVVPSYTLRNQARVPDYHRLDLSLSVDEPRRPNATTRGTWTVSVYNLYARRNAYSIFFRQEPGTQIPQPYRLSTLGTVLPSLSYELSF